MSSLCQTTSATVISPQAGPQTKFLSSPADIAIYGGAAGGGKSWALLAEPLRHIHNPRFGGVIFRRNTKQVRNEGGLWDESLDFYSQFGATPNKSVLKWTFPSGANVSFSHLEHETTKLGYQGAQIAFLGFDELTHFTESQFFYLLSRNRSLSGVAPYIRATTNPDCDSWVARFIAWWIDQETGYAIPERSGVVRWFYRINNSLCWYDSQEEAEAAHPEMEEQGVLPKSFTFVASRLQDNKILMAKDPGYLSTLMAMDFVERERLLGGNWKVRYSAGTMFQRHWFKAFLDHAPDHRTVKYSAVRYWDQASSTNGDKSSGALLIKIGDSVIVDSVVVGNWTWEQRNDVIEQTAELDKARFPECVLVVENQFANKENQTILSRRLAKFGVRFHQPTKNKIARAQPFSGACERGEVAFVRGEWNANAIEQLVSFPPAKDGAGVDDIVDSLADGYNQLVLREAAPAAAPKSGVPTSQTKRRDQFGMPPGRRMF